jgi:hypothetical protein
MKSNIQIQLKNKLARIIFEGQNLLFEFDCKRGSFDMAWIEDWGLMEKGTTLK